VYQLFQRTGTLNIQNGGTASAANVTIGQNSGSVGTVTVNGSGSQLNVSNSLTVGAAGGTGALNIQNGGTVTTQGNAFVGQTAGTGNVLVDGAGSNWTVNGFLNLGSSGNGTLIFSDNAQVSATSINVYSGGLLQAQNGGGTLIGTLNNFGGTFNLGDPTTVNLQGNFYDDGTLNVYIAGPNNYDVLVESRTGAVAVVSRWHCGWAFASPPQSGLAWLCFLFPLIEPDRRFSRIRLSEKTHVFFHRRVAVRCGKQTKPHTS